MTASSTRFADVACPRCDCRRIELYMRGVIYADDPMRCALCDLSFLARDLPALWVGESRGLPVGSAYHRVSPQVVERVDLFWRDEALWGYRPDGEELDHLPLENRCSRPFASSN